MSFLFLEFDLEQFLQYDLLIIIFESFWIVGDGSWGFFSRSF